VPAQTTHDVRYEVCGVVGDQELNDLFASAWPDHQHRAFAPVLERSTCWVTARHEGRLAGFTHVAWDGGQHGFVLDTTVDPPLRGQGIGTRLVGIAVDHARSKGMTWVHADFDPDLAPFYRSCGFTETSGGVIFLHGQPD
jgi:GNAT superfamily N-acetyltransferase